jgi:3alpha(or 20beta)-hydroxysteroid dehydrogenase
MTTSAQQSSNVLTGQVAVVTGGARGIGAAVVRALHEAGAAVVAAGGSGRHGAALAAELADGRCAYEPHDVGDESSWWRLVNAVADRYGPATILVNNAGVYNPGVDVTTTSTENFEAHYRVNQLGTFFGIREFGGPMKEAGTGAIVNISSIASHRAYPDQIAYATTKWAVRGMTKCAAVELAAYGVRVNSVHPGFISTSMLDVISEEWNAAVIAATPMGRRGLAEEVAAAVLYLVSPASSFVTGAELLVDGGLAA